MAGYDGEIRIKTKLDNSEVAELEAYLAAVEKKADAAGKELEQVKPDSKTAEPVEQTAAALDHLTQKTHAAAAAGDKMGQAAKRMAERLGQARDAAVEAGRTNDLFRDTKIHMADGTTFDWDGNVMEEAVRDTAQLEQEQSKLSDAADRAAESMRELAEETRQVNREAQGMGEMPAEGVKQSLTPVQNMLAFIRQSFQDIPVLFGGIADKITAKTRQMETEWDNLSDKAAHYKGVLQELEGRGLGFGNQEYDDAYVEWQKAEQAVRDYKAQLAGAKKKQTDLSTSLHRVGEEGGKAFQKMNSGARKTRSMLGTMASRMKGLLLSLLIFNWISKGFNAMVAGMKKGFENLMKYSGDYANSVQSLKNAQATLGNSFAAAFAPIVQTVIPWLLQLINTISRAMTYVAQFIAVLGGKSTFVRAKQVQDSYNKSLGGTSSAAKKAYGVLAKFDDLDVLQKQDNSGGGGAESGADMFEEVPVDPEVKGWLDGIRDRLKPILDYMKELKDAFMEGFWDGLGDYSGRIETIKKGLEQIKEALLDIWNDPAVRSAADAWAKSLMYMFGSLVGAIASIGLTIAAAFIGGLGQYLEDNVGRIKKFLISAFNVGTEINGILSELFQSIAYIFEAFASESGIRFVAALIGCFADAGMGILEIALKLGRDILDMITRPIRENADKFKLALEGLLESAAIILEAVKRQIDTVFDSINEIYDAHFKPFFDSIAHGLSEIVGVFLDVWNGKIKPIIDQVAKRLSELITQYITPLLQSIGEFAGSVADLLKALWENVLKPLIEWLITNVFPVVAEGIAGMINVIITVVEVITSVATIIIDFLTMIVETVVYFFENWSEIWENIKNNVIEVWEAILSFLEKIWDIIQLTATNVFNAIKDFLQSIWENVKTTATNIWNAIKLFFTTTWTAIKTKATEIWNAIKKFLTDSWTNVKETAIEIWEKVRKMFEEKFNAVKEKAEELMEKFEDFRGNVKDVFEAVKEKIIETISPVIDKIKDFIGMIRDAIQAVKDFFASGFEKIGGAVSGFFGGGNSSGSGSRSRSAMPAAAGYSLDSLRSIPHLASGSVIRGGNPFLAVLGDQRAGQTNVEAPLSTIRQAVRDELSGLNFGGGQLKVVLEVNGADLAQATLQDFLSEMNRQGLDVEVLGVT